MANNEAQMTKEAHIAFNEWASNPDNKEHMSWPRMVFMHAYDIGRQAALANLPRMTEEEIAAILIADFEHRNDILGEGCGYLGTDDYRAIARATARALIAKLPQIVKEA